MAIVITDGPRADFVVPNAVSVTDPTHFDASMSTSSRSSIVSWQWDFGDNSRETATHQPGTYTVWRRLADALSGCKMAMAD